MNVVELSQNLRETRAIKKSIAKNELQDCKNKLEVCTDSQEAKLLSERMMSLEAEYAITVKELDEANEGIRTLQEILLRRHPIQQPA